MSWTKRQFVEAAFDELGLNTSTFDISTAMYTVALRKMDAMVAGWTRRGIRIFYPLPTSPENSDLDQETEVPDMANEAIYTNLALRIAPSFGKVVSNETKATANSAYKWLLSSTPKPKEMALPTSMPAGAGSKNWRNGQDPFIRPQEPTVINGPDNEVEFYG